MAPARNRGVQHSYPRTARVNALLHEVLAEQLERLSDHDERLGILTVTGVSCDPDLRHAVVFLASLPPEVALVLEDHRRSLQSATAAQVRLKRIPQLRFAADPAVEAGARIDEAIRRARAGSDAPDTP
jgi:ribosome-binding factor A